MSFYTPKYITLQMVKSSLDGKVTFSNTNTKYLSDNQVLDNIEDAESWVERILSRQYIINPALMGVNGEPFNEIVPPSTSKAIQKLCVLQACIYIMETEFGKSEGTRGESYLENYIQRFERLEHDILGKDPKSDQYLFPPFPGLMLDPQSSFYQKGVARPMVVGVGSRPVTENGRLNERAIQGQINPFRNWFYNNMGRYGRTR